MGIDRGTLDQLRHLLRPLATRIANTVARGVVQLANDGKKLQLLQLGVLAGETVDGATGSGAEHFQPYGFTSVPLGGAEVVVVFPNGDRSHPLVVAASDRRHRPVGGVGGEVTMYHYKGAKVRMLESGDIEVTPAPGCEVRVSDGVGGAVDHLVKKSEFDGHTHGPGSFATPVGGSGGGGPVTGASGGAAAVPGTQKLRSQ